MIMIAAIDRIRNWERWREARWGAPIRNVYVVSLADGTVNSRKGGSDGRDSRKATQRKGRRCAPQRAFVPLSLPLRFLCFLWLIPLPFPNS